MSRPLIGITAAYDDRRAGFHSFRQDYIRAVELGGGLPVVVAPLRDPRDASRFLERLDGLVLSGGSDVDPALYGQAPRPELGRVVRERDEFELALTRAALERDLPILAICRGHQVLNVATGGTLIQDIASIVERGGNHDARSERWERSHEVHIEPGSRLQRILGRDRVEVNSFHHQAVGELGGGLVVCARSPVDGIIEGVELPERRFVIGVQWHPESFWNQPESFQALFVALAEASSAR